MANVLAALGCAAVLGVGGCYETDNDRPRFTADAWIEFQERDDSFVARASEVMDRFITCVQKAKSDDRVQVCGSWLVERANGLANEYDHCWDCTAVSTGDEDIYDNITTESPCWVALRDLYETQQGLTQTFAELGGYDPFTVLPVVRDSVRLASTVSRKMKQLESRRHLARGACSPQP